MGGDIGIAVHQVVSQKTVGAVILTDLLQRLIGHCVAQCVPGRKTKQAALVGIKPISHPVFLHSMLILSYYNESPWKRQVLLSPGGCFFPGMGKSGCLFPG